MNTNLSGNHKSAGFAHFGLFIIALLLLVGVMGFGAYRAYDNQLAKDQANTISTAANGNSSGDDNFKADVANIKEVDPTEGP